jgi:hypothetical protein
MDLHTLSTKSTLEPSQAKTILTNLPARYEGIFSSAITLPGGKGKGGYKVRIRARKVKTATVRNNGSGQLSQRPQEGECIGLG